MHLQNNGIHKRPFHLAIFLFIYQRMLTKSNEFSLSLSMRYNFCSVVLLFSFECVEHGMDFNRHRWYAYHILGAGYSRYTIQCFEWQMVWKHGKRINELLGKKNRIEWNRTTSVFSHTVSVINVRMFAGVTNKRFHVGEHVDIVIEHIGVNVK